MSSIMPHTQQLLLQWTYTKIKLGTGGAFLPNSTTPWTWANPGPPQLRGLSVDVNADSLLALSDFRWRYPTAKYLIKGGAVRLATGGTSTAPCECVWKAQIEPFSQSQERVLIVCKIQSETVYNLQILCWYCKWALMAVEAQLSFIM